MLALCTCLCMPRDKFNPLGVQRASRRSDSVHDRVVANLMVGIWD